MDIAEFLLARIAEDEAVAKAAVARNGATWLTDDLSDGARITGATEFGNPRSYRGDAELWDDEGAMGMFAETAAHVVRHDPARVLAECESKRAIVERYRSNWAVSGGPALDALGWTDAQEIKAAELRRVLRFLTMPYADHPDYRPEWSPLAAAYGKSTGLPRISHDPP